MSLSGNEQNPKKSLVDIIKENPVIVAVFFVILAASALIILLISAIGGETGGELPVIGGVTPQPVEILPDVNREQSGAAKKDPFYSDGGAPMILNGVLKNSDGFSVAIIGINEDSFVLREGEPVSSTGWEISKINEDSVLLKNDGNTRTITISEEN